MAEAAERRGAEGNRAGYHDHTFLPLHAHLPVLMHMDVARPDGRGLCGGWAGWRVALGGAAEAAQGTFDESQLKDSSTLRELLAVRHMPEPVCDVRLDHSGRHTQLDGSGRQQWDQESLLGAREAPSVRLEDKSGAGHGLPAGQDGHGTIDGRHGSVDGAGQHARPDARHRHFALHGRRRVA